VKRPRTSKTLDKFWPKKKKKRGPIRVPIWKGVSISQLFAFFGIPLKSIKGGNKKRKGQVLLLL
jgi:hypothetical protein